MTQNLNVREPLEENGQFIEDEAGNASQLALTTGDVGIGTSMPSSRLTVEDAAPADATTAQVSIVEPSGHAVRVGRTDTYAFVQTDGNDPMVINPLGNKVGIGTSDPEAGLHLTGKGADGVIVIERNDKQLALNPNLGGDNEVARITTLHDSNMGLQLATNEQARLTVTVDGKVGIGTSDPETGLHLTGEGADGVIVIERNDKQLALNPNLGGDNEVARITTLHDSNMGLQLATNEQARLTVTVDGKVGIGTATPRELLEVDGTIAVSGDVQLLGADCAERFEIEDGARPDPGTVMVIGDEDTLHESRKAYDTRVAGVLSGGGGLRPGVVLGSDPATPERAPLALTGKVYCKVDADHGAIAVGDLLTTSPTVGHAMKADDPLRAFGAILGKALRPWVSGSGLIPVLVALH